MTAVDLVVIGGGLMGCSAAKTVAEGGMRVVLLEKDELGSGASGVNAGTLSLQIKRIKLLPYALRGHEIWRQAGALVGFHETGGLTLAFNDAEAERLTRIMTAKRDAGVPLEFVGPNAVRELEPGLSRKVVLATHCPADGHANASLTGLYWRGLLAEAGVDLRERHPVRDIERAAGTFRIKTPTATIVARRLLIAAGAWSKPLAAMIGVDLPIRVRINTVSVTERRPPLVRASIGHATGLLTLKQKENGTVLIGGGWQGKGSPETGRGAIDPDTLLTNLRLAQFALPALGQARLLRTWTGFEPNAPDFYPLAGALPGVADAWVLACVRGGYTIGPYIGRLLGAAILGREPEMPLFDPGRTFPDFAPAMPVPVSIQ